MRRTVEPDAARRTVTTVHRLRSHDANADHPPHPYRRPLVPYLRDDPPAPLDRMRAGMTSRTLNTVTVLALVLLLVAVTMILSACTSTSTPPAVQVCPDPNGCQQ